MGKKTCGCCDTEKNTTQFYKIPIAPSGFSSICKLCAKEKYKANLALTNTPSASIWLVLAELGVPFLNDIWQQTELSMATAGQNTDIVMAYLRALEESGVVYRSFADSDVMLDMLVDTNVDREAETEEMDLESEIYKWGKFVDSEGKLDTKAYQYLNTKMEEYTGNLSLTKHTQINRYRDLCKAELRKVRLEEDPNVSQKDISAATAEILTLMKVLKIDNFQSDSRTDVEKTIEYQMALMEKTKPCEDEDITKYQDFCGFYKLEQSLTRPLRNLVAGTKDYPSLTKEE